MPKRIRIRKSRKIICEYGHQRDYRAAECKECRKIARAAATDKTCKECNINKTIDNFPSHNRENGIMSIDSVCKDCVKIRRKNNQANKTPEQRKHDIEKNKKWMKNNPEKAKIMKLRERCTRNGQKHRADEIIELILTQTHCAICGIERKAEGSLHIDHDHATGEFRGLICQGCNQGLGNFRDNEENLQAAIKYLNKSRK